MSASAACRLQRHSRQHAQLLQPVPSSTSVHGNCRTALYLAAAAADALKAGVKPVAFQSTALPCLWHKSLPAPTAGLKLGDFGKLRAVCQVAKHAGKGAFLRRARIKLKSNDALRAFMACDTVRELANGSTWRMNAWGSAVGCRVLHATTRGPDMWPLAHSAAAQQQHYHG